MPKEKIILHNYFYFFAVKYFGNILPDSISATRKEVEAWKQEAIRITIPRPNEDFNKTLEVVELRCEEYNKKGK